MKKSYFICIVALFSALTYIATAYIQIPIPLGYANLGDSIIIFTSVTFGPVAGMLAGAIGASLADILTGYAYWAPATFIIKAVIGIITGVMAGKYGKQKKIRIFTGAVVSMIFMTAGYTASGMVLYGSVAAGLSSAPGLAVEGVVNIAVFYAIYFALERAGFSRRVREISGGTGA